MGFNSVFKGLRPAQELVWTLSKNASPVSLGTACDMNLTAHVSIISSFEDNNEKQVSPIPHTFTWRGF